MATNYTHKSIYFCGNKVSDYGLKNGYVDYATLAKAFDAVLCNDITKLFYSTINGEYNEVEQVGGFIDNQEQIDELQEQIDELQEKLDDLEYNKDLDECITGNIEQQEKELEKAIDELQEQIDELQREQDEQPEIYQYFIVSDAGADLLKDYGEIVYYIPTLDIYVWGVTHWGTSWDYVLTNIKIDLQGGEND